MEIEDALMEFQPVALQHIADKYNIELYADSIDIISLISFLLAFVRRIVVDK